MATLNKYIIRNEERYNCFGIQNVSTFVLTISKWMNGGREYNFRISLTKTLTRLHGCQEGMSNSRRKNSNAIAIRWWIRYERWVLCYVLFVCKNVTTLFWHPNYWPRSKQNQRGTSWWCTNDANRETIHQW